MAKAGKGTKRRDGGNTITPSKNDKEHRRYVFTWNNYEKGDMGRMVYYFTEERSGIEYIFQEEVGECGTPHLQGCFKSKNSIPFKTLKNRFPKVHWEVCKDWAASVKYCSKDRSRVGAMFTNIMLPEALESGFNLNEAADWQVGVLSLMEQDPDNRIIYWYWSKRGRMGKTTLARYLVDTYNNQVLYVDGKGADIKFGVQKFVENKSNRLRLCIFGFTRSKEDYVSYDAIEAIKDGIFFSGKYEAGMVRFNSPHIVVLANFPPKISALSADRWRIINVSEDCDKWQLPLA